MNVLDEAAQLIDGERQEQYGDAAESHQRIADLWASYLGTDVTEFDVVNMMILLKVSRTRNQYHRDSYVDIAGYSALGERLHQTAAGTGAHVHPYVEEFIYNPPRVWWVLEDVPKDVDVVSAGGAVWHWYGPKSDLGAPHGEWLYSRPEGVAFDYDLMRATPFTEVLEDK